MDIYMPHSLLTPNGPPSPQHTLAAGLASYPAPVPCYQAPVPCQPVPGRHLRSRLPGAASPGARSYR